MPSDGREMPDSAAAGQSPQTLKSARRLLNGSVGEEDLHQPARVGLELAALGRGVAVAEDQEVDLVGRVARALQRDERRRPTGGARAVDEHVVGIDDQRPDLAEVVGACRAS